MTTDLMLKILKSPEAKAIVQRLSPVYGEAYTALWIFEILGREWDDLGRYSDEMLLQVVPQTATWSIPYWEDKYGVARNENLTLEQRRQNVLNVMRTRGPENPYRLAQTVSSITGCKCEIQERTGKNKFTVVISADADPNNFDMAYKAIKEMKQAHLIFDVNIKEDLAAQVRMAASMTNYSEEILNRGFSTVLPDCPLRFGGSLTDHAVEDMNAAAS